MRTFTLLQATLLSIGSFVCLLKPLWESCQGGSLLGVEWGTTQNAENGLGYTTRDQNCTVDLYHPQSHKLIISFICSLQFDCMRQANFQPPNHHDVHDQIITFFRVLGYFIPMRTVISGLEIFHRFHHPDPPQMVRVPLDFSKNAWRIDRLGYLTCNRAKQEDIFSRQRITQQSSLLDPSIRSNSKVTCSGNVLLQSGSLSVTNRLPKNPSTLQWITWGGVCSRLRRAN